LQRQLLIIFPNEFVAVASIQVVILYLWTVCLKHLNCYFGSFLQFHPIKTSIWGVLMSNQISFLQNMFWCL